jgi:hypothetical protein
MIRLKQIQTVHGDAFLTFEYTIDEETKTVTVDRRDLIAKAKEFQALVGRAPSLKEFKEILIHIIEDVRKGKDLFIPEFDYESLIGVDLEAAGP